MAGTSTGSRSPPLLFNNNDLVNSSDAVVGSWNSDRSWEEWGGGGGGGGSTLLKQTSNSSSAGAGVSRQFSSMTIKPRGESVPSSIETGNNSLGSTGSGGSGNNAVDDLVVVSAGTSWPGVGGISPRDFMPFKDRISGQNHPALVASADSSLQPSKAATTITTPSLAPITLPAGRLRKLPGVKLLNSVSSDQQGDGDNIWIPITQDEGFITEDMARDQELMFERMGTSKEAARERMRMQSQGLVSGKKLRNIGWAFYKLIFWIS